MDNIAKTAEDGDVGKALSPKTVVDGVVTEWQYVEPGGGTEDYTDLENKPQIGGVTLSGDKSLHDLGIAAESAIPDVSGKANLSVVAPVFDQASANDAGSLVTYTDGVVYVLPEGHTAGTTWANTQKTATNIAEQQRLLKTAIQGVENLLTEETEPSVNFFDGNFDESGYIDNNGADAAGVNYKRTSKFYPIDTTKTKLYTYREEGTVGTLDMCFYNSSKVYISKVGYKTAPKEITLPEGAAYFRTFCNADYNGGITVSYTSVNSYIPYSPGGLKIKDSIIGYDNLTDELQEKIDDIDEATAAAEAAEQAVGELIVNKATANLFDSDFDESGYIDDENGDKASSSYVRTSKYYPVDESKGTIYSYNPDSGNTTNLLFYNAQKVFLSRVNIAAESTSKSIPEGAAYFRLYRNYYKTQPITITYDYEGRTIPYRHWSEVKENMVGYDSMTLEGKRMLGSVLAGRKILVFGDSIIGNDRTEGVCDFLAEYSGATIYNGAIGGTRITDLRSSQYDSPNYVYFDGVKLVHALMTNTWTDQDAHVGDVSAYVETDTLPMLKALDCSQLDVIVIAYGRNDVTSSETTANIEAALATIIDDIQSHYPNIRILVLTPIWGMFTSGTVDGDDYVNSNTNMTLRILADTFTGKAKAKHVSSIDMLENMQLSQNMMDTYMDNDHVHLNSKGNAMYAHILNGKLRSMF